jgi:hypothetical protein
MSTGDASACAAHTYRAGHPPYGIETKTVDLSWLSTDYGPWQTGTSQAKKPLSGQT